MPACHVLQGTRAALASEEPRVDWLQTQLKELVTFPDLQSLSDSVVAAIQEYQRYPGRLKSGRTKGGRDSGCCVPGTLCVEDRLAVWAWRVSIQLRPCPLIIIVFGSQRGA